MNSIDKLVSKLPYTKGLFGDGKTQKINNKYEIFADANVSKDKGIQRLSIVNQYDTSQDFSTAGGKIPDMFYNQLMYGQSSDDKKRRIVDFRVMAQYPEVEGALREICDEMFSTDDQGQTIKMKLRGDYNDTITSTVEKEFQTFLNIFKFHEKGWQYMKDFLIEGEMYFENIVSAKKPHLGIIGVTKIANERIDPLYYDLDNELIDSFILRTKEPDQYPYQWGKVTNQVSYGRQSQKQILFLNDKQITYVPNDQWESEGKKYRVPHLANAQRPYRQLSLIEDATVIYMLVRAPERFVFNIATGKMPAAKAEQYMKRLMSQFWSKKTIGNDGRIENTYDPISMVENIYLAKPSGDEGSTVESIGGGDASPDNLEILNFFVQKLYKSLHVPLARLNSETAFSDGDNITREELRFAKFIISVQKLWAAALKRTFIVHLKLKGKKLTELSKKLDVKEINVPKKDKSAGTESVSVKDVYSDSFNVKCWDYYDILSEAVQDKIDELVEETQGKIDVLTEQYETIEKQIMDANLIITESNRDTVNDTIKLLKEDLVTIDSSVKEYDREIKEIKEDGRSWWDQYELKEEDIDVKFNEPSQFFALREQQIFQLKFDNFNNMSQNDLIDNVFAQKIYLGWTDKQILANMEMLRKTAALRWELSQIEQNGPDFREKALEEMQGGEEELGDLEGLAGGLGGGGGGGSLPAPSNGGGGGDASLPNFGAPPSGEGGAPAAGASSGNATPPPAPTGEQLRRISKIINEQYAELLKLIG